MKAGKTESGNGHKKRHKSGEDKVFYMEGKKDIFQKKDEIRCIDHESTEYPQKLKQYPSMPKKLYVKGNLPQEDCITVAVVGARMCSPYGRIQAFRYAKALSEAGIQVISGLAQGIDAEGQSGALEGKTPTYAVLGSGPDVCYPSVNKRLYQRILWENGGIISEYPPGFAPRPYCFPARNRIISALSDAVLVVEAKERSGSLITAGYALDQGKSVFAVPGAVCDELSRGCHKLIYDGAGIAYSPEIILEELGICHKLEIKTEEKNKLGLATDLNMVYSCLDLRPKNIDFIVRQTGLSAGDISRCLVELSLMGLIRETGRHYYVKER